MPSDNVQSPTLGSDYDHKPNGSEAPTAVQAPPHHEDAAPAPPPDTAPGTASSPPPSTADTAAGTPARRRWIAGIAGAVGLGLVVLVGAKVYENMTAAPPQRPGGAAVAVDAAPVETRPMRRIGRYSGTVQPASEVTVAPQIAGQIERIHVDLGDTVTSDALLFELDAREATQRVHQSDADLRVAKASLQARETDLRARERDLQRLLELFDDADARIVSRADVDAAETAVEQARANVAVAEATVTEREAALTAARIRQELTAVRATWLNDERPHYVAARHRDVGSTVSANTPVLSIVDLDRVRVVVSVPEREYVRLKRGQLATIRAEGYEQRRFEGTVTRIAPSFDEALREARVEIEVANEDGALKPGMFVGVDLVYERIESATAVPATALVTRTGERGVLLVVPPQETDASPTARFVPVRTGVRDGAFVQIVDPPLSGRVVTLGAYLVEDGAAVRISEPAEKAPQPRQ